MNLTKDSIWLLLRKVTIPASTGSLFMTFYNLVDTYFAGKITPEALAAVAKSWPITFIALAIAIGIQAGTQSETQLRLRGKGMSILRQTRRGDMYVEANVEIPVNLNTKQKGILQEFEKEGGTSKKHSPKSQSFFSKLKEVWEDLT